MEKRNGEVKEDGDGGGSRRFRESGGDLVKDGEEGGGGGGSRKSAESGLPVGRKGEAT